MTGEHLYNRTKGQLKSKLADNEGAQLVGRNLKAYPSRTTASTITVTSGSGTHTTSTELVGIVKLVSIKAPSNTAKFYVTLTSNGNSMPLLYNAYSEVGQWTYKTEIPTQDEMVISITTADTDGSYSLWIQYESGATAVNG